MAYNFMRIPIERWRQWTNGTIIQRIFRAAVIVSFMTGLVTLGFVLREIVVAAWFGTSGELDAFLIAFLIPWTTLNIIAGAFGGSVIPVFIRVRDQEGQESAQELFSRLMTLSVVFLSVATLILAVGGPWLLKLFSLGFSPAKAALTVRLFYILLPILLMGATSQMWAAVLNAGEKFMMAALAPVAGPLMAVCALVTAGSSWGIFALAAGTTCGYLLELVLVGSALRIHGLRLIPGRFVFDRTARRVTSEYFHLCAALLLMNCINLINQALAASLGPGSVSALTYAGKLIGPIIALGPVALGSAALPYFSVLAGRGDRKSAEHTLRTSVILVLVTTIPISLALCVFSEPLIRIIFQRGAFTPEDTPVVAAVQAIFAFQLPFFSLMTLGIKVLSAAGRNSTIARIALFDAALNGALVYVLIQFLGLKGIALATSLTFAAGAGLTFLAIRMAGYRGDAVSGVRD